MTEPSRVADVVDFLSHFAPPKLAEEWDNTGLLVGDEQSPLDKILTCLTLTPDVAQEAIDAGVDLIVSHHPIMFRPIQQITAGDAQGKMLLDLIQAGIAVYSPHTSYDSAAEGINRQLAECLNLIDIAPLRPEIAPSVSKIVCFVPVDHLQPVRQALWDAGAGHTGEYSQCSFSTTGTGTFLGSENTNPAIGIPGQLEQVDEYRLEVVCFRERVAAAVTAMVAAHPYEEPAYDIIPLADRPGGIGSGRWGNLPEEITLAEFNQLVKKQLKITQLQFVGEPQTSIRRVAIACGAAAEFLTDAHRMGCDLLLTGEARFHALLEARQLEMSLVLPGHYATERPAMERLAERLANAFPKNSVWASRIESDPLKWDC